MSSVEQESTPVGGDERKEEPTTEKKQEQESSTEKKQEHNLFGPKCRGLHCKSGVKPTKACPTCIKVGLPAALFCSTECFTKSWKAHAPCHKLAKKQKDFQMPKFRFTGPLRPALIGPYNSVPGNIEKPEYWATGQPTQEDNSKKQYVIHVYKEPEIERMRQACRLGRQALDYAGSLVQPGVTTDEIDRFTHQFIVERGGYPSPLNYRGFKKSICTSINEVICHGIPDARPLEDGDIINIDISVFYKGMHADLNETFLVGTKVDAASKRLIKATYDSLMAAISQIKPKMLVREVGGIISGVVEKQGLSVVRTYCGHGVGELFHCAPNVPHYKRNKAVGVFKPGMMFTVEPMINQGEYQDVLWQFDDWTSVTTDGKRSAQFEHTMVVTEDGVEILTAKLEDSPPYFWEVDTDLSWMEDPEKKKKEGEQGDGKDEGSDAVDDSWLDGMTSQGGGGKKKGKKKKKKKGKRK